MDGIGRSPENTTRATTTKGTTMVEADEAFPGDADMETIFGGNWHSTMGSVDVIHSNLGARRGGDDGEIAVQKRVPVE